MFSETVAYVDVEVKATIPRMVQPRLMAVCALMMT